MDNRELELRWVRRLYRAVEEFDIYAVKHLVNGRGASPDVILPEYGVSAFHLAVGITPISFSKEVTEIFLAAGGNPNVRLWKDNFLNKWELMFWNSCSAFVINRRCNEGVTPVHVAAIRGHAENLELLLLAGGDPMALDDDGFSSLDYALEHNQVACVAIIQEHGGYRNLALGLLNAIENGVRPRDSENLNVLDSSKLFDEEDQLMHVSSCRMAIDCSFSSACQVELENYNGCFSEQESNNHLSQSMQVVDNNLILSEDFLQIIDAVNHSLEGDDKTKRLSKASDQTFSIHGSPIADCLNYHRHVEDYKTSNDLENGSNDESRNKEDDIAVRNVTWTFPVYESPFYPWSNFYVTNDKSMGRGSSPLGDDFEGSFGALIPNSSLMILAEPLSCSSPVPRKIIPICQLGDNDSLLGMKFDSDHEISSNLSLSCPNLHEKCFQVKCKNASTRRKLPGTDRMECRLFSPSKSGNQEYFAFPEDVNEIKDEENGILLEEKQLETPILVGQVIPEEGLIYRASSVSSLASGCTEDVRRELCKVISCGCSCPIGPITPSIKRVYVRLIKRCKMDNAHLMNVQHSLPLLNNNSKFSRELEENLKNPSKASHGKYFELERKMMSQFDGSGRFSQWREGNLKSSFNYLLLDPRMTLNLPTRWANSGSVGMSFFSCESSHYWREFLSSIFYVGKGKRSRSYAHLYEAVAAWRNNGSSSTRNKYKVKRILEIWKEDLGVVCLHLFQNAIPAEALTREAAMIDALGLKNLTNEQRGKYYGHISTLGFSEKRYFGSFLLHRALIIFLAEGERQIKPAHIN